MRPEQYRIIRDRLGLTQPEMANRINELDEHLRVNGTSISRYERGKHTPSAHVEAAYETLAAQAGATKGATMRYQDTNETMHVVVYGAEGIEHGWGYLTTDHAVSSYGQPVLVLHEGTYGSGESVDTEETRAHYYTVAPGLVTPDPTHPLFEAARVAGYNIVANGSPGYFDIDDDALAAWSARSAESADE